MCFSDIFVHVDVLSSCSKSKCSVLSTIGVGMVGIDEVDDELLAVSEVLVCINDCVLWCLVTCLGCRYLAGVLVGLYVFFICLGSSVRSWHGSVKHSEGMVDCLRKMMRSRKGISVFANHVGYLLGILPGVCPCGLFSESGYGWGFLLITSLSAYAFLYVVQKSGSDAVI